MSGRSRGGSGTKLRVAIDAPGNMVRLILTGGQVADVNCDVGIGAEQVVADGGL